MAGNLNTNVSASAEGKMTPLEKVIAVGMPWAFPFGKGPLYKLGTKLVGPGFPNLTDFIESPLKSIGKVFSPRVQLTDGERVVLNLPPNRKSDQIQKSNASTTPSVKFPTLTEKAPAGTAPAGTAPGVGTLVDPYVAMANASRDSTKMMLDAFNQSKIRGPKEDGLAGMYAWQNRVMEARDARDRGLADRGIAANSWGPNDVQLKHLGYDTPELRDQYRRARAAQDRADLEGGIAKQKAWIDREIAAKDPRFQMVHDPEKEWEDNKKWIDSLAPNDPRVQEVDRRMKALGGGLGSLAEKIAVARVRNGQVGQYNTFKQQPTNWSTGQAPWTQIGQAAEAKTIDGVPVRRAIPIAESKSTLNTIPSTKTPTAASVPSSSYNPNNLPTIPLTAEMKAFLGQGPNGPQPQTQFLDRNAVNQLVANQNNSNVQPSPTQPLQSLLPNPYLAWMNDIQATTQNNSNVQPTPNAAPHINSQTAGNFVLDALSTGQPRFEGPIAPAYGPNAAKESYDLLEPVYRFFNGLGTSSHTAPTNAPLAGPYSPWMNDVQAATQGLTPRPTPPEAQVNMRYYPDGPQPSASVSPAVMELLNQFYGTNAPQPPPIPFWQKGQFYLPRRAY